MKVCKCFLKRYEALIVELHEERIRNERLQKHNENLLKEIDECYKEINKVVKLQKSILFGIEVYI